MTPPDQPDPSQDSTAKRAVRIGAPGPQTPCLLVLTGPWLGRVFPLEREAIVLGRSNEADLRLPDDGVSRRHARLLRDAQGGFEIEDLDSTNGTHLNGHPVTRAPLRDGDRIQLGSELTLKFAVQDTLEVRLQQELYDAASRDGLTGLFNQQYFLKRLAQEVAFGQRHGSHLALCLLDVDRFKEINDTWGHPAGDAVLVHLPKVVTTGIRLEDVLCRYGGDELALILRELPAEHGEAFVERIRRTVEGTRFPVPTPDGQTRDVELTISVGLAAFDRARHTSAEALLASADRQLYAAKHAGGNRVACSLRG